MTHICVISTHIRTYPYQAEVLNEKNPKGEFFKRRVPKGEFFKNRCGHTLALVAYVCLLDTHVCQIGSADVLRMFAILTHMFVHPQGTPRVKIKIREGGRFFF